MNLVKRENMSSEEVSLLKNALNRISLQSTSTGSSSSDSPLSRKRRARESNWSRKEKIALLDIAKEYKEIIENKGTDNVSVRVKNEAWSAIAVKFKHAGYVRETQRIREFYRRAKQDSKSSRMKLRKTSVVSVDDESLDSNFNNDEISESDDRIVIYYNLKENIKMNPDDNGEADVPETNQSTEENEDEMQVNLEPLLKKREQAILNSFEETESYDHYSIEECRKAQLHALRVQTQLHVLESAKVAAQIEKLRWEHQKKINETIHEGITAALQNGDAKTLKTLKDIGAL